MNYSPEILVILINCLSVVKCEECGVTDEQNIVDTEYPSVPQIRQTINEITVEIGIYFDIHLRQKFNNNDKDLEKYIKVLMSGAQTVFKYPTMRTAVNLIVTRFEVLPNNSVPYVPNLITYHDTFCEWQSNRLNNHPNYDLALLLTSKNLFLDNKGNNNGYAPISRLCRPQDILKDNCALIKANYVNAMWTIAHEIGHKLGISHDTDKCGPKGVMNRNQQQPFHWTNCSNNYLEIFVSTTKFSECLFKRSGHQLKDWDLDLVDFHSYSMEKQCALNFGPKYKPYDKMIDVCEAIPCVYDLLQPVVAGPPLENTVCKNKTFNFVGKCLRSHCIQ